MATTNSIEKAALGNLVQLGVGGQGMVFSAPGIRLAGGEPAVYKEYLPAVRANVRFDVLGQMTGFLDSLSQADAARLSAVAAWPSRIVTNVGQPVGFLMPAISDEFRVTLTLPSGKCETVEAELQHLLNPDTFLQKSGLSVALGDKFQILRETAELLLWLHGEGITVGDLSAKNVLYSVTPYPRTFLIDCDSMAVQGVSVGQQLETPGWDVRSVSQEPLGTPQSDAYKFGLIALRLLVGDQLTRDPMRLPGSTPPELRALIANSLSARPDQRPGLHEWIRPLATAARTVAPVPTVAATTAIAPPAAATASPVPPSRAAVNPFGQRVPRPAPMAAPAPPAPRTPAFFGRARLMGCLLTAIAGLALIFTLGARCASDSPPRTGGGDDAEPTTPQAVVTSSTAAGGTRTVNPTPSAPATPPMPTEVPSPTRLTDTASVTYGLPYSGKAGTGAIQISAVGPRGALADMRFRVYSQRPDVQGNPVTGTDVASGGTNNTGRLSIELPPGEYIVTSGSWVGYNWGNYKNDDGVTGIRVEAGRVSLLTVAYGMITARVTTPDGPVNGEFFRFFTQRTAVDGKVVVDRQEDSGRTDNRGSLSVYLTPGKYTVSASPQGYNWGNMTENKGASDVEVVAGIETFVDLKLGKLVVTAGTSYVIVYTRKSAAGGGVVPGDQVASGRADNTGAWETYLTAGSYVVTVGSSQPFEVVIRAGEVTRTGP